MKNIYKLIILFIISILISGCCPDESINKNAGSNKNTGSLLIIAGFAAGIYRLDVTAYTVDGKRAGKCIKPV